jgi:hypothetical protein
MSEESGVKRDINEDFVETNSAGLSTGVYCPDVDTSDVDERKLMRRIDLQLVPLLALLYLLNSLDRGNIGNARVTIASDCCDCILTDFNVHRSFTGWKLTCISLTSSISSR